MTQDNSNPEEDRHSAELEIRIREIVATAPPLSGQQITTLRILLASPATKTEAA